MDRAEPVEGVEVGEIIGGYRLERLLSAGSVSRVFLGTHLRLGRRAAIKVLLTPMADDARVTQRFLNEARVVNDIRHPNIVDVSDFIESESPKRLALVMEYIEGPSLKSLGREGHRLSFPQAIGVALQLCAAVEAAHGAGVIHRDLKPDNLLLTSDPTLDTETIPGLKVVDFGIAKIAGPGEKTATGMMIGTPAYMAPEQIAGKPPPSPATDVFAIGEVIYELLTGKRAYPAGQINAMIQTKLKGERPLLDVPDVPGGMALKVMIERCLASRPQDRPRIEEVRQQLLEVCPEAESAISIEPPAKNANSAEADTLEPRTVEPAAPNVAKTIPAVSTSPTLQGEPHVPTVVEPQAELIPQMFAPTFVRDPAASAESPAPFDDSTTVVRGGPSASGATQRPPRLIRLPLITAVIPVIAALVVWAVWPKDQVKTAVTAPAPVQAVVAEPIVVVPRSESGLELITQPEGARVEEVSSKRHLGETPIAVEHKARVRISKEGYEPMELELPSAGKSMTVELTKKARASKPAKKAEPEKNLWDY